MTGLSESTLQKYWRKAVLKEFNYQCAICFDIIGLECHHYIKRRIKILRHDWRNGIALCQQCHKEAHTRQGNKKVEAVLENKLPYLFAKERLNIKDYCTSMKLSQREFLKKTLDDLKLKIGE